MFERICVMSKEVPSLDFLRFVPHAIEAHWDNVYAPRLAGFPVNIVYKESKEAGNRVPICQSCVVMLKCITCEKPQFGTSAMLSRRSNAFCIRGKRSRKNRQAHTPGVQREAS